MLQSFFLINEFKQAHALAPVSPNHMQLDEKRHSEDSIPESILKDLGFRVYSDNSPKAISLFLSKVDAVLLAVSPKHVAGWQQKISGERSLPVFWWCDRQTFPSHECKLEADIDGLLGPMMSPLEIHCSLLLGTNHFFQRTAWQQEREQLLSKLEERKWVDQAKRILSEVKGISEAEAYDFLRKQAMNERKRMVDVATSIVKVYQLLQDDKKGGRRR